VISRGRRPPGGRDSVGTAPHPGQAVT